MSDQFGPADPGQQRQPTEEELRAMQAAYEEQLKQVRVADVLIQDIVSVVNLAGRKAGLAGDPEEKDLDQLRMAIEAVRALLPLVEAELGPDAAQIRNAISQLQMVYAQERGGGAAGGGEGGGGEPVAPAQPAPPKPGETGPAQSSGRLWVPGQ